MRASGTAASHQPSTTRSGPLEVFGVLVRHRRLIFQLTKRDVLSRYRGSILGPIWMLLSPFLMLLVYTFVFSVVFQARWDIDLDSRSSFALMLFTGLIVYWFFADCLNRAPKLMFENVAYVRRMVFPVETLPWVALLSSLTQVVVNTAILLASSWALIGTPPLSVLLLPLLLLPLGLLTLGLCWILASLGVFFRDLREVVPVLTMIAMFLSPIFYPISALPVSLRSLMNYNPLAWTIGHFRGAVFTGDVPGWTLYAAAVLTGWLLAWLGLLWFHRTRQGFADVI